MGRKNKCVYARYMQKRDWSRFLLIVGLFAALNLTDFGSIPGGDIFRDGKIRYLFLVAGGALFVYLRKHLTFGPAAFACMAVWSYVLHDFLYYAGMPLLMILTVMGVAVAVVKRGKELLGRLLILSGTLQAGYALLQLMGIQLLYTPLNPEHMRLPVAMWGHETVLGPFLVACLCPALWGRSWVAAALMTIVALATASSMTIAALGAVYLVFLWHLAGWRFAALPAAFGACGLAMALVVAPDAGLLNINGRGVIWRYGWEAFLERPLFGHGIGSWAGQLLGKYVGKYAHELHTLPRQLHMDALDFLVEYGVVGALPLAAAGGLFLRNFRPTWAHAVCVGLLVNGLANFPLCLPPLAVIFVACWALSARSVTMEECQIR